MPFYLVRWEKSGRIEQGKGNEAWIERGEIGFLLLRVDGNWCEWVCERVAPAGGKGILFRPLSKPNYITRFKNNLPSLN